MSERSTSGKLRRSIGIARRTLAQRSEALKGALQKAVGEEFVEGNNEVTHLTEAQLGAIQELDDEEFLDSYDFLSDARSEAANAHTKLHKLHAEIVALSKTSDVEMKALETFVEKYGDFTKDLENATGVIALADIVLDAYTELSAEKGLDLSPDEQLSEADASAKTAAQSSLRMNPFLKLTPPIPARRQSLQSSRPAVSVAAHTTTTLRQENDASPRLPSTGAEAHAQSRSVTVTTGANLFAQAAVANSVALPKFNGDITGFAEFTETFESLFSGLDDVTKLRMLTSCLGKEPKRLISGLRQVDRNYKTAMAILRKEYDKPYLLRLSLLTRLRLLPDCDADGRRLRETYLALNELIYQLAPDGEPDGTDVLTNIILSKLPTSLQTRIVLQFAKSTRPLGVYDILTFVADDVERERVEDAIKRGSYRPRHTSPSNVPSPTPPAPSHNPSTTARTTAQPERMKEKHKKRKEPPEQIDDGMCRLCLTGRHFSDKCTQYPTLRDRQTVIAQRRLCHKCLEEGHFAAECRQWITCLKCKGRHNTALCRAPTQAPAAPTAPRATPPSSAPVQTTMKPMKTGGTGYTRKKTATTNIVIDDGLDCTEDYQGDCTLQVMEADRVNTPPTPLLCLNIYVSNPEHPEKEIPALAFFDTGSNKSYVLDSVTSKLKIPCYDPGVSIVSTFANKKGVEQPTASCVVYVKLRDGSRRPIQMKSTPFLCNPIPWMEFGGSGDHDIVRRRSLPKILLGMDLLPTYFLHPGFSIRLLPSGIQVMECRLGPILCDAGENPDRAVAEILHATVEELPAQQAPSDVTDLLSRFWDLESLGIKDSPTEDDEDSRCLQMFKDTLTYDATEKRFYCSLPFKEDPTSLVSNFGLAFKRLISNYNNLRNSPRANLLEQYNAIFMEQLDKGILEDVPPDEYFKSSHTHYLAHHAIVKETSSTTKVRPVLDGSAKTRTSSSINDCLYKGPSILPDLLGTLLRTRFCPILLSSDVEKAFHMVGLSPGSRDFTRLLWLKDFTLPPTMENLRILRFCRVPFGLNVSPFLLAGTIFELLDRHPTEFTESLRRNIYVDNVFHGALSFEDAKKCFYELRELFSIASMNLREWTSNCPQFNKFVSELNLGVVDFTKAKVLGVHWNTTKDVYTIPEVKIPSVEHWTRRLILKFTHSIYDPPGFGSPAILPFKAFLQLLWKEHAGTHPSTWWDTKIDGALLDRWLDLLKTVRFDLLSIPRMVLPFPLDGCTFELHAFVDASAVAYCAAIYVVARRPDGSGISSLLVSKTRLAPLRPPTNIPRLELLSNVLGSMLMAHVKKELPIHIDRYYQWSDSMIALYWITGGKRLPTFIQNRVKKITELSPSTKFRHIDGTSNPADCGSRGLTCEELSTHKIWWKGPSFLKTPEENWPVKMIVPSTEELLTTAAFAEPEEERIPPLVDANRFSQWSRLLHTMLFVILFLTRISKKWKERYGTSRASLIQWSEIMLFRQAQNEFPPTDSIQRQLRLFRCPKTGLWRCRGRITNAEIPDEAKHPIYIPRESRITRLYILFLHSQSRWIRTHFGRVSRTMLDSERKSYCQVDSGWMSTMQEKEGQALCPS